MTKQATTVAALALLAAQSLLAADLGPVSVHGTLSQGYVKSENNNYIEDSEDGTFDVREYGANAIWQAMDKLRIGGQVFGREYGTVGNDKLYLDWASVDYRPFDWLGILVGRVKVPMGLYNETRDIDALRTEVLLPQSVYPEISRELTDSTDGGGIYGDIGLGAAGTLSYQVVCGQLQMDPGDGDMSRIMGATEGGISVNHYTEDIGLGGALDWQTPLQGLRCGVSYSDWAFGLEGSTTIPMWPMPFTIPMKFENSGVSFCNASVEYTWGDLVLASEVNQIRADGDVSVYMQMDPATPGMWVFNRIYKEEYNGWYVKADYRFCKYFAAATGYGYTRAEYTDTEAADTYVSARFDITDNFILKIEEHYQDGTLTIFPRENPAGVEPTTMFLLVKATVYF